MDIISCWTPAAALCTLVDEVAYDIIALYKQHPADEDRSTDAGKSTPTVRMLRRRTCASAWRMWPSWRPGQTLGAGYL